MTTTIATVNANLFRIVASFISTEETRYYLRGVNLEPHPVKGVLLVATDGHRLFAVHDETGTIDGPNAIVALDKTALTACKTPRRGTDLSLHIAGADATIKNDAGEPIHAAFRVIVDGSFPDWRRILPAPCKQTDAAAYDGRYLADFGKAGAELRDSKNQVFSISGDGSSPAIIRYAGIEHAFGLLMPVRMSADHAPAALPVFATLARAADKVAA